MSHDTDEEETEGEGAVRQSQKKAEVAFTRVAQNLPKALVEREDTLLKTFAKLTGSDVDKLRWLYNFMDELDQVVDQFTPCKSGCTACCHYAVEISELEIELIEAETSHSRLIKPVPIQSAHGCPCPLLQEGKCSVYLARPFVCRTRITLDDTAKWCAPEVCHDVELPQVSFSEVAEVFDQLRQDGRATADIRERFGGVAW